jgi:glycosyltransferase involved in cell wall biosynthesis
LPEPLISVIVPVFAGERFLADALDTVAAQTHPRVETIVVDDGSPDRSAEIAAARPGVRLLREPHRGVAAARNAGLAAARGELVAFLDQDDQWWPHKLARQAAALAARPELAIVRCHMQMTLLPGVPRPDWFEPEWLATPKPGYVPSTWLVRRDAFARVGEFDTSYAIACDSDWLTRAKDAGLASEMLADVLVRWRVHGENGSYDQATMRREMFRMLRGTAARQREGSRAG